MRPARATLLCRFPTSRLANIELSRAAACSQTHSLPERRRPFQAAVLGVDSNDLLYASPAGMHVASSETNG